jgi:hypothetical protein
MLFIEPPGGWDEVALRDLPDEILHFIECGAVPPVAKLTYRHWDGQIAYYYHQQDKWFKPRKEFYRKSAALARAEHPPKEWGSLPARIINGRGKYELDPTRWSGFHPSAPAQRVVDAISIVGSRRRWESSGPPSRDGLLQMEVPVLCFPLEEFLDAYGLERVERADGWSRFSQYAANQAIETLKNLAKTSVEVPLRTPGSTQKSLALYVAPLISGLVLDNVDKDGNQLVKLAPTPAFFLGCRDNEAGDFILANTDITKAIPAVNPQAAGPNLSLAKYYLKVLSDRRRHARKGNQDTGRDIVRGYDELARVLGWEKQLKHGNRKRVIDQLKQRHNDLKKAGYVERWRTKTSRRDGRLLFVVQMDPAKCDWR